MSPLSSRPLIAAIGLLASASVSQAAVKTWDGGLNVSTDANWLTGANWDLDVAPVANDSLTFDQGLRDFSVNNFAANTQFSGLNFGANGTGDITISGNAINLAGNIASTRTTQGTTAINLNLALQQTTTVTVASSTIFGAMKIGGVISAPGFGITKAGTGALTLSGANTYTGPTAIQVGTLRASSLNSVSSGSASSNLGAPTTVANGTIAIGATAAGTLVYTGSGETTDRVIDLAGTTFGAALDQSGTGLLKFTSNLTATGAGIKTLTLQGSTAGTGEISGVIADNSGVNKTSLTKVGSGTWTLSGASVNTYTGATTVNRGTLALDYANLATPTDLINSGSALALGGSSTLALKGKTGAVTTSQTFASTTINPGATAITVNSNAGTATNLTLGAITRNAGGTVDFTLPAAGSVTTTTANALYTGGQQTILEGATVGNTWAVSGSGATPGAISGLATYNAGFAAGTDVDAATGASAPAAMTVNSVRFNGAGSAAVTLGGATTVATGGILVTPTVGNNAISITGSTLTSGNAKDLVVIQNNTTGASSTLTIGSDITGSIGLAKSGAGTLILTGPNTYTGATSLNGGVVNLGVAETVGVTGPLGKLAAASPNTILFNGGTLQYSAANQTDYSARFGTGANQALNIDTNGQNVTFATATGLASAGGTLTKIGAGTLTLPASTYTGATTVSGGTLQFNGALATSNIVNNGVVGFGVNANALTGVISGSGSVIRNATNTTALILNGANTYTGTTELSSGVLGFYSMNSVVGGTASSSLGAPTSVAAGTIKVGAGAAAAGNVTLRYFGDGETTDRVIEMAGLAGNVTLDRNQVGNGLWKFTGNFTSSATGNKTLNLSGGYTGEIAGVISDSSVAGITTSVTKASTSTWTLSGNNTYTGATAITGGILNVSSLNKVSGGTVSSSLGAPTSAANGTIGINAGTLAYTGTGETTDRVINLAGTTGGATLDQSGTGLLRFSNNLTATGAGIKTLTLQGSTAGTGEIAGAIVDNTLVNKTSLTKAGTGTWTLSGANAYTGATTVSAGKLVISTTGTLGASNVTLANIAGAGLTLNSVSSFGDSNTLTFGSLSTINMDFAGSDTLASIIRSDVPQTLNTPGTYTVSQLNGIFGVNSFQSTTGGTFTIVVPEPSAAILSGLGCLALLRRRRN